MEIGAQIKRYRAMNNLSQEELAERIFVSRQTISNWETEKSYPDIHSLILLSSEFEVSLDQLIKGDIEEMKEEINKTEIRKMNRDTLIFTGLFIASILSPVPLIKWLKWYGFIPYALLFMATMYFALRLEKIKKDNNVQTYKEIVAFTEGKRLDEISSIQEKAKRPYQKVMALFFGAAVALVALVIMELLFKVF